MHDTYHNVLFDLDGTLTDPKEGIINSILYSLEKLGIKENHTGELDSFIGPPLRSSYIERYRLTDKVADKAVTFYREYFSSRGIYENNVYPGIKELLESLSSKEFRLFLATSKPTVFSERILHHFNLEKYFSAIIGSNLDNTRTDKTEIIAYAVSNYNLKPEDSVMVGDRMHDILGARNNFMKAIAVTYGYGSPEELQSSRPDYMADDCKELESIILAVFNSGSAGKSFADDKY